MREQKNKRIYFVISPPNTNFSLQYRNNNKTEAKKIKLVLLRLREFPARRCYTPVLTTRGEQNVTSGKRCVFVQLYAVGNVTLYDRKLQIFGARVMYICTRL